MVKYADAKARTHAGETIRVLLPWQVCSGFAHGRGWAHMGMLQTETVREIRPGVQAMRLTNSLDRTLSGLFARLPPPRRDAEGAPGANEAAPRVRPNRA